MIDGGRLADCPAVSFRFVYLHKNKEISKCKTIELGDQLLVDLRVGWRGRIVYDMEIIGEVIQEYKSSS